jgi:signal transduction histidine kinase
MRNCDDQRSMNKPHDTFVLSSPASASEADDASRFAACCAVACERTAPHAEDASSERGMAPSAPCRSEPSRQLVDLSMIVCMAAAKVRSYANEHGCQLRLELPSQPLLVMAAPAQLEIAAINLLRGAIDAGATAMVLTGQINGAGIQVHVEDNRASDSPHADELSRSIAKRIVEDHGGQLGAVRDEQRGASVWLTLPRQDVAGDGVE